MISRRRLIVGGLGAVGVAGLGAWGLGRLGFQIEIGSILRRRLSFLKLDEGGIREFAKDQTRATFGKKIPTWNRLRYHLTASGASSFKRFYRSTDTRSRFARFEDTLVSTYLLSSDFFWNGSDESRKINYVAFYDPIRACNNPFARPAGDA
jgi:hypothetical protein